jgi:hypothetical protein
MGSGFADCGGVAAASPAAVGSGFADWASRRQHSWLRVQQRRPFMLVE